MKNVKVRSFLKWPGGKYNLIENIVSLLPKHTHNSEALIEPFVGSAIVFLNTNYDQYILSDVNLDLINIYKILKRHHSWFIDYTKSFFIKSNNTKNKYYKLRQLFNNTDNIILRSALFLYLNRHCYNGLCRYNQSGEFNSPFGQYNNPYFPQKEMEYFIIKAQRARFYCRDFTKAFRNIKSNQVMYCDPPYVPLSTTASFTTYSGNNFGKNEQIKLANLATNTAKKFGSNILISNHYTKFTQKLYQQASSIITLQVKRNISCKINSRNKVTEMLALFN